MPRLGGSRWHSLRTLNFMVAGDEEEGGGGGNGGSGRNLGLGFQKGIYRAKKRGEGEG